MKIFIAIQSLILIASVTAQLELPKFAVADGVVPAPACSTGTTQQQIICKIQNKQSFTVTEITQDHKNQFFNKLGQPSFSPGQLFWNEHPSGNHKISVSAAFAFGTTPPASTFPYVGAIGQLVGECMSVTNDMNECDSWVCHNMNFVFFQPGVVPCQQWDANCQIYANYDRDVLGTLQMSGVEGPCPVSGGDTTFRLVLVGGTNAGLTSGFAGRVGEVIMFVPADYSFLRYTFKFA